MNMNRLPTKTLASAFVVTASAFAEISVYVGAPSPASRYEVRPAIPAPGSMDTKRLMATAIAG
jgi:hypothetical protein